MAVVYWPASLVPTSESWQIVNASRSGGASVTGAEQIVSSPTSRWKASLRVPIFRDQQILDYRAMLAGLEGRAGILAVGPTDCRRAPWKLDADGRKLGPQSYRDPALDGTPYADPSAASIAETLIRAITDADTGYGSGTIRLAIQAGGIPVPGNYLGVLGRLYMITGTTGDPSIGSVTCGIRPLLRNTVFSNTVVDLLHPVTSMRLASDDTGALDLQMAMTGSVTLDLVEAF